MTTGRWGRTGRLADAPWLALALAAVLAAGLPGCGDEGGSGSGDPGGADALALDAPGDAGPDTLGGSVPDSATERQIEALHEVNKYRRSVGLDPVDQNEDLNEASQSHAEFIVNHCQDYESSGTSPHEQVSTWEGFTGRYPWDRMKHYGYSAPVMSEVIAFENSPKASVKGWIDTLYHRLPLLDPSLVEVGYGGAANGAAGACWMMDRADVMDLGMSPVSSDAVILYPPDGSALNPRSFNGMESPQPPPPPHATGDGWPSGSIITVQFGQAVPFEVVDHQLLEAGTIPVDHVFLGPVGDAAHGVWKDPNLSDLEKWLYVAMYAHLPLKAKTEYKVVIDLTRGGEPLHLEWTFLTGNV